MVTTAGSWRGAIGGLWRRAPLWRLSALSAGLLTLSFLLFPPAPGLDLTDSGPNQGALATYVAPAPPAALPTPPVGGSAKLNAPFPAPASAPPAIVPPGPVAGTPPRNADLSLAAPGPPTASGATGLNTALVGRLYSGSIKTAGYGIPLPSGNWALLSNQKSRLSLSNGANVGEGMLLYLGRIENKKLTSVIHIMAVRTVQGSLVRAQEAQIPKSDCENGNANTDGHWSCFTVNYSYFGNWSRWADRGAGLKAFERAPAGDLAAKGVPVPNDFIGAEFWRSEAWGALLTEYMFSPEADGITSTQAPTADDSDWTPAKLRTSPERRAYVDKIRSWGKTFWPQFKQAFAAASPVTP